MYSISIFLHFIYWGRCIRTQRTPPPTGLLHISIQTAGLALGGTGLCSYRVRSVDGSCAEHLTVESYTVIYAANSYTYYY